MIAEVNLWTLKAAEQSPGALIAAGSCRDVIGVDLRKQSFENLLL